MIRWLDERLARVISDENRVLALLAGLLALAGPRKTRPLAGFLYGAFLSRVQGAQYRRAETTIGGLFAQKTSVGRKVEVLESTVLHLEDDFVVLNENFARVREGQRVNAEHFDELFGQLSERIDAYDRLHGLDTTP